LDYNIQKQSTLDMVLRLRDGVTEEELRQLLEHMTGQIQQLQQAVAAEQAKSKLNDTNSITGAIRKEQKKEISPKKYINVQSSGNFKVWAKDMKDLIFWHDKDAKDLIVYFENQWSADSKLTYPDAKRCCADKNMNVDVDKALHMVIGAFLEGESKMLAETAELSNPDDLEMHKSGLKLWRLLKYNLCRASALNVISIVEVIRNMQPAKNIQELLPKVTTLERAHQG
jgi:hypothetical protein